MKPVLDSAQTRAVEELSEKQGTSTTTLMDRAGVAVAQQALKLASSEGRFFILCGPGNNGGDGLVAARELAQADRKVAVELLGDPGKLKESPRLKLEQLTKLGIQPAKIAETPRAGDVVIDALFGTGLSRAPSGEYAEAIGRINAWGSAGARVLAVDVASGLQSDTGHAFDPCVQASATAALGTLKPGHVLEPGRELSGTVEVADIGLPALTGSPSASLLEEDDVRGWIPKRSANAHKGTFGHVLVIAGSRGKSGAAAMAGVAALRAGAGLVTVATQADVVGQVLGHAPELMALELASPDGLSESDLEQIAPQLEKTQAVVVGPGIPKGEKTAAFLGKLLTASTAPMVIDADGLNALADHLDLLTEAKAPVVLTPHPGEMARLTKLSASAVQADRLEQARKFASTHGVSLVLKGAATVVATPDGVAFICPTGNPGMATAGTGDVLSGILGGLLAQRLPVHQAVCAGVYAHGLAADEMARKWGQQGLMATDLFEGLGQVWAKWDR